MSDKPDHIEMPALARTRWRRWCLVGCSIIPGWSLRAEDHVDYKFEDYNEDNHRIHIQTHSALFEAGLGSDVKLQGEFVYDAISGATPTGAPPPAGSDQVPLAHMEDIRKAGNLSAAIAWGRNTTTPQVAYSIEDDYESIGVSLSHSIDFNEKNTTLTLGAGHNFDTVMPRFWGDRKSKDATDFLIGVTQLLGPKTVISANLTLGYETGFLADPYRNAAFTGSPLFPNTTPIPNPEKRPENRSKQVFLLSVTQYFESVNGSAEMSYRFHHDSYDIFSNTVSLEWFQKLGKHVIVSPIARYYRQSAASFYATLFPGDPQDPFETSTPTYYSADYRLSEMETFTYGLNLSVIVNSHVYLDAAYKRYTMRGLDGVTSASMYPEANVFTVGARVWF